jgi:hypothetical protein
MKRAPTSTELLKDFITTNLPEFGAVLAANSNSTTNEEKDALKKELKTYFFISPQDRIDDIEEEDDSHPTSAKKESFVRSTSQAIKKVQEALVKRKSTRINMDTLLGPDVATEALLDAKIRRSMIRTAALYVIEKCKEYDEKREAEIKARGDEKEIEAWFNGPRYHDQNLLWEARDMIEEKFLKPVRDE